MSTPSSLLRGITNSDLKNVIRKAFENGWQLGEMSGTTHARIVWPASGEHIAFGTTISDRNAYKTILRRIETIQGFDLFPKHKSRRSKKKFEMSDFHKTFTTESQIFSRTRDEALGKRVTQLLKEHKNLTLEFRILGIEPVSNSDINQAMRIVRRIAAIEETLVEMDVSFDQQIDATIEREL